MDQHWSLKLLSGSAQEPLTLARVKTQVRLDQDWTVEDEFLNGEIAAARTRFERVTGRQLLLATYLLSLDHWPCDGEINPRRTPLREVVSIEYVASDGTLTTLGSDQYEADTHSEPGRITPAYGVWWPATRCSTRAVRVTYRAGHDTLAEIPDLAEVQSRLLACIAYCYRNREQRDEDWLDSLFASLWNGV